MEETVRLDGELVVGATRNFEKHPGLAVVTRTQEEAQMVGTERETIPGPIGKSSPVRVVSLGNSKMLFLSGMATVGEAPHDIQTQTEMIFPWMNQLPLLDGPAT